MRGLSARRLSARELVGIGSSTVLAQDQYRRRNGVRSCRLQGSNSARLVGSGGSTVPAQEVEVRMRIDGAYWY